MHPEIKKFWERRGKSLGGYSFSGLDVWFIRSDPEYYDQGGPPPPLKKDIVYIRSGKDKKYRLDDLCYSEEKMLRLIKMKAFI